MNLFLGGYLWLVYHLDILAKHMITGSMQSGTFTLEVDDKEFMIFAGPVGCGILQY